MNCPKCGTAHSNVIATRKQPHGVLARRRLCYNSHRFTTLEVQPQTVHVNNIKAAAREAKRKADLWRRDSAIVRDPRPAVELAAELGISPVRVREIRRAAAKKAGP